MTNDNTNHRVSVSLLCSAEVITAELQDGRPDVLALFGALPAPDRDELARDAWTIGLRALGNAYSAAREARLEDVGAALLTSIDSQLQRHIQTQQQTIGAVLARFFDPKDGQVSQRLAAFVDDHGVLARLLDRYLAPQNSVLSTALARQVGESSPLFQKLSPTDSEGLVKVLEGQLRAVMDDGHAELVRALDPLAEDGAVARFLRELRQELKAADQDRSKQLEAAVAALDANDENSLLSRLVRETQEARQDVLKAVNPNVPDTPLAILKNGLMALMKEQGAEQLSAAQQQMVRQEQFEKEVREVLARIETRRSLNQKSPRGGLEFEDAVVEFIADATRRAPCTLDVTGTTVGAIDRCKKGDAVLRFTAEHAFAGAGVVFEAKREAGYTAQRALNELDLARKNRNVAAGVFVLARSHAGAGFPRFARYGSNVLLVWDEDDSASDPYLEAAILLGMALVTRTKVVGEPGDMTALRDLESRIQAELTRLDKMEKHTDAVQRGWEGLVEELRRARSALGTLLKNGQRVLRALNQDVEDDEVERRSPICLDGGNDRVEPSLALDEIGRDEAMVARLP